MLKNLLIYLIEEYTMLRKELFLEIDHLENDEELLEQKVDEVKNKVQQIENHF